VAYGVPSEKKYLKKLISRVVVVVVVGLALMGVVLLLALTTVAWVYLHCDHRVLPASGTSALVLSIGPRSSISTSTIVPMLFDES
jgi:hypothetical protein